MNDEDRMADDGCTNDGFMEDYVNGARLTKSEIRELLDDIEHQNHNLEDWPLYQTLREFYPREGE